MKSNHNIMFARESKGKHTIVGRRRGHTLRLSSRLQQQFQRIHHVMQNSVKTGLRGEGRRIFSFYVQNSWNQVDEDSRH